MKTPLKNIDKNIFKDIKLDKNNNHCKSEQKKEYFDSNHIPINDFNEDEENDHIINLNEDEKNGN